MPQAAASLLMRWAGKKWLLIYDNLEDKQLFARYNPNGRGAIVITTRLNMLGSQLGCDQISLARFSKEDSIIVFNHFRKLRDHQASEQDETHEIDELIDLLDGLALGIKQIASYIGSEGLSVREYLAKYKSMPRILLSEENVDESKSLAQAWAVEFAHFREKQVHACQLLSILSLLSAHKIQMDIFETSDDNENLEAIFDVFDDDFE